MLPKVERPRCITVQTGGGKLESGGPSLSPEYSGPAVEVKAACVFCTLFKAVRLNRRVRTFCRLSGDKIKPDHYCDFFEERGAV